MRFVEQVPAVASVLEGANHVDVKTVEGEASLREFLAGMSTFMPAWVRFLFRARVVLVWALRLDERAIPEPRRLRPEQVPMQPGEQAFIFTVRQAEENRYWLADVEDRNLSSSLGVVVEPLGGGRNRFHVVTVVRGAKPLPRRHRGALQELGGAGVLQPDPALPPPARVADDPDGPPRGATLIRP